MALLGIDFGTANIRIAAAPERGEPHPSSVAISPSVVSFNGSHIAAGDAVLMMAGAVPDLVVPAVKRLLGRQPGDEVVKRLAGRCGFEPKKGELGLVLHPAEGDTEVKGSMGAIAGASAALQYALEQISDDPRHDAVVAIPGWFDDSHRQALKRAAKLAGVNVVRFVRDVVASGLWAAHAHRVHGHMLVLDVGAGGVSGGILKTSSTAVDLLASAGSVACGGDDVDAQLAATAIDDPGRKAFELVRQACEALKRALGTEDSAQKKVSIGGDSVTISVERWELDLMMGGMSQAISEVVKGLFDGCDVAAGDIEVVLGLGGMCGVAGVQREIDSVCDAPRNPAPPRVDATVLGALRIAMAATNHKPMRHAVNDGEGAVTPLLSDPPPGAHGRATPVVKKKAVLRQRPQVTRKRIDPRAARKRRPRTSDKPAEESASIPPEAVTAPPPDEKAASEPPKKISIPPQPAVQTSSTPPRRRSDGAMPQVPKRQSSAPAAAQTSSTPPVKRTSPPATPRASSPAPAASDPPEASVPDSRPAHPPPPPKPAQPKYPARDGHVAKPRYPMRDRSLKAPAVPSAMSPRRQHTTQPSERPPATPVPISVPPGDPLAPTSEPSDPGRASDPGRLSDPGAGWHSAPPGSFPPGSMPPPYSQPPPGQHSIAPAQLPREGNIVGIKTAAEIMAQPITGAIRPDQLEPISMPVLLRRIIGRRNVFGTLEILADNFELRIDCEGGTAFLTKSEHSKLIHTFDLDKAEWRLLSTREEDLLRKPFPFARLAIEGLRKLLREQRSEDCKEALGDRLQLAPKVRSDRRRIPKRLGLAGREIRFIENYFDGLQSGHDLADTGPLGASTSYQLLMLLDLYDALEWADVEEPDTAPLADKLVEVADRLEKANYFDVLVVHWSAKDEEFKARYDARKAEFGPGSENDKLNPDACKRIMSRIEVAWLTLKDTVKRTKHRNESFPGQDFQSAADLAHRKRMREKAEAMMKTKK